jgi:hypothetical protein
MSLSAILTNSGTEAAPTPLFHGHINAYGQFALDLNRPSFLEAA